jgi:redox-sensitive bicupin YhaK (pirin superfamily)
MTSGRGIMHEEMPRRGPEGNIYGFQLWVNLPASRKMGEPRYQEVSAATIPTVRQEGVTVRIVAGEYNGVCGPVTDIAANPLYLDVSLAPGTVFEQTVPEGHSAVAYVFEGQGIFGVDETGQGEPIEAVRMLVFEDGEKLVVRAAEDSPVRFMLMTGAPFKEPIIPYGPFVMNTVEEIQQALDDLRRGTFVS